MSDDNPKTIIDAYKAIIDFNKTIITISSSVLTALIAYVIYQNIDLKALNYISIGLIVLAIQFSLFGFGGAIKTVKDGISRPTTVFFSNASGFILISGIVLTLFAFKQRQEKSVDDILKTIEKSTTTLNQKLSTKTMKSLEYKNDKYTIIYQVDSLEHIVVYEVKTDKIESIK
jgi:hypothetical protein